MTNRQQQVLSDPEARRIFEEELLIGEATDTVAGLLESLRVSQKELASRLGVSEGRVSQVLSGAENITLRTLASLGWALGARFEFQPIPVADRSGTPAQDDPAFPRWAEALAEPRANVAIRRVQLPTSSELVNARPPLRVVEGTPRAA